MEIIEIKLIETPHILTALPLLVELNESTPKHLLEKRLLEMTTQNYKCVGLYINKNLVGISGLWFLTRHYCGRTIEPDHVIISKKYRNKGLGKLLFEWIYKYATDNGYESIELNTYIENIKSHNFYENEDFKKLGFHFLKKL
ncbi:GNAT family N-acetyltransferase [uncultured Lutibacter sp.]|uniref:GNAT family N-acetyltransferase n=1 Tax=uncultured Lutibacter sp. TaxID=437739 RepID=UPI002604C8CC|nr:GNAT family N-acetyltransferase [uncultured Lutibacter sp.]